MQRIIKTAIRFSAPSVRRLRNASTRPLDVVRGRSVVFAVNFPERLATARLFSSRRDTAQPGPHADAPVVVAFDRSSDPRVPPPGGWSGHTVLVDGSPLFFKAWHTAQGRLTKGGLFGFTKMLLRIVTELQPYDHIGCFLDSPNRTQFRRQIYPQYKAHRPPLPDDAREQLSQVPKAIEACGVRGLTVESFEADDLIASYAAKCAALGHKVTIVSSDKDLHQLVTPSVCLFDFQKGEYTGESAVRERWKVPPASVPDVQALCGDLTDNIPGLKGCGIMNAAKYVQAYGSLENIIAAGQTGVPMVKRVQEAAEQLRRDYQLVKLRTDVPVPPVDALVARPLNVAQVRRFCAEQGFASIVRKLDAGASLGDLSVGSSAAKSSSGRTKASAATAALPAAGSVASAAVSQDPGASRTPTTSSHSRRSSATPDASASATSSSSFETEIADPPSLRGAPTDARVVAAGTAPPPSSQHTSGALRGPAAMMSAADPPSSSAATSLSAANTLAAPTATSAALLADPDPAENLPDAAAESTKPSKPRRSPKKQPAAADNVAVAEPVDLPPAKPRLTPEDYERLRPPGVTIVRDRETARRVAKQLRSLTDRYHACDTETIGYDLSYSVIGQDAGKVICFSIYCGPDVDFGGGPCVWVDNLDECEGLLDEFKEYFEDAAVPKVWHNYGFDRHVLMNAGVNVQGFGGDTMQMGRLWDSSRLTKGGYSLQGLIQAVADEDKAASGVGAASERPTDAAASETSTAESGASEEEQSERRAVQEADPVDLASQLKITIQERFGSYKVKKDGTLGKQVVVPELDDIQRDPAHIHQWIEYSAVDAAGSWKLRNDLEKRLRAMPWREDGQQQQQQQQPLSMWDFYRREWLPFGELLTDLEREGIKVDIDYLRQIEKQAEVEYEQYKQRFVEFAVKYCPDAVHMNIESDAQKQQFFFGPRPDMPSWNGNGNGNGGYAAKKPKKEMPPYRDFDRLNTEGTIEEGKKRPKKTVPFRITGLGMPPVELTDSGLPAVSGAVLRKLAGKPKKGAFGLAYKHFKRTPDNVPDPTAEEACHAIEALIDAGAVSTMLDTFIRPLQSIVDARGRVHTSLNMNTETGRLSSRRPNLQNQPALEKDRYRIRDAFTAEDGKLLIVADYGQLELRLLAHITDCRSMIQAFREGGDFHSRTAVGMYPEIAEEVARGDVLLEWDHSKGKPPVPLVKDKYADFRRKAKTLNFSIAYGKTAMGLSKDWGVSIDEAKETLERWYRDRPEVRQWQERTIAIAREHGWTRTLLGRYRLLPGINSSVRSLRTHSERAAINTPLQGGAADVVARAMVLLHQHKRLRELGWRQLLQIHDEIILEGPEGTSAEALDIVNSVMRNPLEEPLRIDLDVDAKCAKTWFKAK